MILPLIRLIEFAGTVISLLIIARVILSWVISDLRNPVVAFVYNTTEPLLAPVRNVLPTAGGIDFSPVIVLIAVQVLERVLVRMLFGLA